MTGNVAFFIVCLLHFCRGGLKELLQAKQSPLPSCMLRWVFVSSERERGCLQEGSWASRMLSFFDPQPFLTFSRKRVFARRKLQNAPCGVHRVFLHFSALCRPWGIRTALPCAGGIARCTGRRCKVSPVLVFVGRDVPENPHAPKKVFGVVSNKSVATREFDHDHRVS